MGHAAGVSEETAQDEPAGHGTQCDAAELARIMVGAHDVIWKVLKVTKLLPNTHEDCG